MIFQQFLKGISGLDEVAAEVLLRSSGILCNWWRNSPMGFLPIQKVPGRLNARNIEWHLSRYYDPDPLMGNAPFHQNTPFISTTAGSVQRNVSLNANEIHSSFLTALQFATNGLTGDGAVFYGYLMVIGKKSVELEEFAEETRELNIWTGFQPYHPEGEIVAKIRIPPQRLQRAELYNGPKALADLDAGLHPQPSKVLENPGVYTPPENYSNVRDALP